MQNLNRVHLNGLRAVESAGRLGSLSAAAEELGVTVGAVSQQVQKTERQLGRTLFLRQQKGLVATAAGLEVIGMLTTGFSELSLAVARAMGRDEHLLTVSVAPVFAGKWLVWRLHQFNAQHPEIRLRVDANVALVDPDASDIDVCIRVGRGGWPNVRAEKLVDHKIYPVCSPALAVRLRTVEELGQVPVIRDPEAMFAWKDWLGPSGYPDMTIPEGPVFSDASLCLDAAIAGQGVFLAWETLANDAVRAGRLVAPFPGKQPTGLAYWFITGRMARPSRAILAFRKWIKAEIVASID